MVEEKQIRDVIAAYVVDGDAEKFVLDFGELSYNIHKEGTPEAEDLANRVMFRMSDVYAKLITREQFRESLKNFILQGSFNG